MKVLYIEMSDAELRLFAEQTKTVARRFKRYSTREPEWHECDELPQPEDRRAEFAASAALFFRISAEALARLKD